MQALSVVLFLGILAKWSCNAVFLNHRPFPTYSLEQMPETQFSCREKILGGYYADPDAQCQMFHVCVKVAGVGVQDFRFLCPNGTAFDQDHQICAEWEDVDCDATTLYYSSDNFDLYRVGSGFESKAHKYGEDEETFALQRAETGDARINRDPQVQVVNQNNDYQKIHSRRNYYNNNNDNNNQERDIFKASSSSNFFNNKNNGKENDDEYDDNININQNNDYDRKKIVRKQNKRPVQQNNQQTTPQQNTQQQTQTRRPQRPTGFANNFAGSYSPTTPRVSTTSTDQTTAAPYVDYNFRIRNQRQRVTNRPSSTKNINSPTPTYTVSTPAPFRQSPAVNRQISQNYDQYSTSSTSSTENYPTPRSTNNPSLNYNTNYDVPKITKQQTENYPSNNPQYTKSTTPFINNQYNNAVDKKPTSPKKTEAYKPTTFSPNAKPFSIPNTNTQQQNINNGFPTTFAPRTQQAYTQIAQQTNTYNTQKTQNPTTYETQKTQNPTATYNTQKSPNPTTLNQSPSTYNQPSTNIHSQQYNRPSTTLKPSTFTQYTPTVPKISPTTPVSRSNRFDETQYDDGSYNSKYDYNGGEDEFLNADHSHNIASSRNELARAQKQLSQSTTHKSFEASKTSTFATRPTENYSRPTQHTPARNTQITQKSVENKSQSPAVQPSGKKIKDVSYDYAYYDSLGSEQDYQIDTEIKKAKN